MFCFKFAQYFGQPWFSNNGHTAGNLGQGKHKYGSNGLNINRKLQPRLWHALRQTLGRSQEYWVLALNAEPLGGRYPEYWALPEMLGNHPIMCVLDEGTTRTTMKRRKLGVPTGAGSSSVITSGADGPCPSSPSSFGSCVLLCGIVTLVTMMVLKLPKGIPLNRFGSYAFDQPIANTYLNGPKWALSHTPQTLFQ